MIVLCEKFKILSRKAPGSILLLVFRLILLCNKRSKKSTKDRERKIKKSDERLSVCRLQIHSRKLNKKMMERKGKMNPHAVILGKGQGFLYFVLVNSF